MNPSVSPPTADRNATPEISLRGISVSFGSVQALSDVDLTVGPGERHAVVGENGAGKSTLMRVLFGLQRPDRGEIRINGTPLPISSPADAIRQGIGMVHQHFALIPSFTVAENVVLGAEPGGRLTLDRPRIAETVGRIAQDSGLPVDPDARVEELSVSARQRVEIVKALYRQARVLILDEPTAVLAPAEAAEFWSAVDSLSRSGVSLIFVTHKLDEVMAHADSVTVLRQGRRVLHARVADTQPATLAAAMVGKDAATDGTAAAPERPAPSVSGISLQVRGLFVIGSRGETAVDGVSFELRAGEILGIAGVDGSGQRELVEAIAGLRKTGDGTIALHGREVQTLPVAKRRDAGMGYIPEDRHGRGLVLSFSVEENAILGRQRDPRFSTRGILRRGAIRRFAQESIAAFGVRGRAADRARDLSGGNQQKLVLARELSRKPTVLLASQPSRGLDFASTAFVHDALRAERDRGAAVLVQSLDLEEVLALSDRVAVMLRGRFVAVLSRAEATPSRVGALMTGAAPAR